MCAVVVVCGVVVGWRSLMVLYYVKICSRGGGMSCPMLRFENKLRLRGRKSGRSKTFDHRRLCDRFPQELVFQGGVICILHHRRTSSNYLFFFIMYLLAFPQTTFFIYYFISSISTATRRTLRGIPRGLLRLAV